MSLQDGALIGDSNLGLERKENRLRCIQLPWREASLFLWKAVDLLVFVESGLLVSMGVNLPISVEGNLPESKGQVAST